MENQNYQELQKHNEELDAANKKFADEVEKLQKSVAKKDEIIADLRAKLKEKSAKLAEDTSDVVKDSDGNKYGVTSDFTYKGKQITRAELAADPKLVDQLVEKGIGFLIAK